jgi:feruloyl esterase
MLMAQRYPTYFDGIVSGAPAMRTGHSNLALRWNVAAFSRIAPRDAAGKPVSSRAFSEADRKAVVQGILGACDDRDGAKDGMVFDARGCAFDPATLVCKGPKAEGCLSAEQAAAVARAFSGPKDSKGRQVYPGFPYDTGIAASAGIPGILAGSGPPVGAPVVGMEQDVDREAREADANAQAILTDTASWTNLSTFSGHGGRIVFFHGVSDPWFSARETTRYYEALAPANGGTEAVSAFSRLFLVPGMGHCGGGPAALDQFDLLSALVDWVEKDAPPDSVTATGEAFPGRSRPLCAYPRHAQYKGAGDPESATSFACRE